ncbi:hypothetical protein [Kibdelosporangium aridum]|uniref:hypothetical protein n=1 Tax=Kibdelosporangium aridum TaxID=2030 RepID=UPI000AEDE3BE|nr:hypothetical protein [Kibdelosporangium aridum]
MSTAINAFHPASCATVGIDDPAVVVDIEHAADSNQAEALVDGYLCEDRTVGVHGSDRGPRGRAATSPIHETDIAAVAAQALRGSIPADSVYTLTGPQSLDQYEKVRLIGAAIGRTLSFQELPPEQVRQGMLAQAVQGGVRHLAPSIPRPSPGHGIDITSRMRSADLSVV